jgi:hypothetical protein
VRCLTVGGRQLWDRFDNGDNVLFRQQDFEAPARSPLFAELLRMSHPEVRSLTAALIDAARMPLDQTPRLEELVPDDPGARQAPPARRSGLGAPQPTPVAAAAASRAEVVTPPVRRAAPKSAKSFGRLAGVLLGVGALLLCALVASTLLVLRSGNEPGTSGEMAEGNSGKPTALDTRSARKGGGHEPGPSGGPQAGGKTERKAPGATEPTTKAGGDTPPEAKPAPDPEPEPKADSPREPKVERKPSPEPKAERKREPDAPSGKGKPAPSGPAPGASKPAPDPSLLVAETKGGPQEAGADTPVTGPGAEFLKQINQAVDNGVTFLKRKQRNDGAWPFGRQQQYGGGSTALAGWALLEAGVPANDPIGIKLRGKWCFKKWEVLSQSPVGHPR